MYKLVLAIPLLLVIDPHPNADEAEAQSPTSKTQLEAFEVQTGAVLIKCFSTVGTVTGTGTVSVDCREIIVAARAQRKYGIVIEVSGAGRLERQDRSSVDYDEIAPLLAGIDYILTVGRDVTKLDDFEAVYNTNGDLRVTVFTGSAGKLEAAVSSGSIGAATAFLSIEKLRAFRDLIAQAKTKLDAIK